MKNLLTLLLITVVSTVTNAENSFVTPRTEDIGQRAISTELQIKEKNTSEVEFVKNEANNLGLWKTLDTNKDDLISKTEAASSKAVLEGWDEMDTNKDEKLDYIEFSRLFYHK